jgi:ABC-type multidrug transport system fused ATPase/permease subunit
MIATISRTLSFFERGQRAKLAGLFCLMFLGALLEMAGIGLFLPFLQIALAPERLARLSFPMPGGLERYLLALPQATLLMSFAALLFAFYLLKNVFLACLAYLSLRFTFHSEAALQRRLLAAYLARPYAEHLRRNSSELIRTVMNSSRTVFKGVAVASLTLAMDMILALAAASALLLIAPKEGLFAGLLMLGLVAGLYLPIRRQIGKGGQAAQRHFASLYYWMGQSLGSVKEIKVLGREPYFLGKFGGEARMLSASLLRVTGLGQMPRYLAEIIVMGVLLGYFALSVAAAPGGLGQSLPVLGVFAAAALRLLPSVNRIIQSLNNIREGRAAVDLIHDELLALGHQTPAKIDSETAISFQQEILLDGVDFRHAGSSVNVLQDIHLRIEKGASVALAGASGAGKTTLADILLGLLLPSEGCLRIDGRDAGEARRSWQDHVGFVPQNIYLLDDTIRRNVAFGLGDEEINEAAVRRAIQAAQLEGFVASLPQGLDTVVAENGARLSGGQRQRLGIARALYRDPDVLVLDEATSALDGETEREVVAALDALKGSKTLIVVAHRLSTIRSCDRVVFLEQGRLLDQGGFDELAQRCEPFRRMVQISQAAA